MKRSRSLGLPLSCCRTRLSCVSIDSVRSGTSPTSPSACRSASLKPVDLLIVGSRSKSMPRLLMPVWEADIGSSSVEVQFRYARRFSPVCSLGYVGRDHLRRIDDAVEQLLGHKAELQRGFFEGQVVVHCVMGDLRCLVVADDRRE